MNRRILRTAGALFLLSFAVGLPAFAQGTAVLTGTVVDAATKKPVADVVVTATSPNLQGEQTVVTDAAGVYRIPQLPPGIYTLRLEKESYKPYARGQIQLRLDGTTRVNIELLPEAIQAEDIVVVGRAPTIDVASSTTGVSVGAEMVRNIAVVRPAGRGGAARSFESLAELAPGTTSDDYGVSISGTSSPENQYVVDGLSVNDPGYGILGTPMSVEFVQEVNVITGGYMPEYGRATGGVLNVVTKSGSNELHGSIFGNISPGAMEGERRAVAAEGSVITTPRELWNLGDFGAELGGPILKDKLWFYAGVAPSFTRYRISRTINRIVLDAAGNPMLDENQFTVTEPIPGTTQNFWADKRSLQYIAKLTYLVNADHNLTLSVYGAPSTSGGAGKFGLDNQLDTPEIGRAESGAPSALSHIYNSGGNDVSLKWASSFLEKRVLLDVTAGWHHQTEEQLAPDGSAIGSTTGLSSISRMIWRRATPHSILDFEPDGPQATMCTSAAGDDLCPAANYVSGGPGFLNHGELDRIQSKAVGTVLARALGHHVIKAGLDFERMTFHNIRAQSGGVQYRESRSGATFSDYRHYGFLSGPDQIVHQDQQVFNSTSNTIGGFVQDSWNVLDLVTVNAGLRYDNQTLIGDDQKVALALPNQVSPRVGVIYDFTQQGRSKIFANWARFYESVPLDMVDRSFPGERRLVSVHAFEDDPANGIIGCDPRDPSQLANQCKQATNIVPANDPFDPNRKWSVVGGDKVPVDPAIKPQSSDEIVVGGEYELIANSRVGASYTRRWLNDVIEDMSRDDGETYFIGNPGQGFASDFPKAQRQYNAFTVYFNKAFSDLWLAQVSYTYSSLVGNISGLFNAETQQLDPNINSDFDLVSLLPNRLGPLRADRPHQLKAFAAKEFVLGSSLGLNLGLSYRVQSGIPLNYLGSHPDYGSGQAYILPRGSAGRLPAVHNIDLRLGVNYRLSKDMGVTFSVDAFNVFNFQQEIERDENYTFADVLPIKGGTVADLNKLQYTDGTPFDPNDKNPNFNHTTAYQAPRSVRFGAKVTF